MPCNNVWVTSFVTGVPSRWEYMCWEDSGGNDDVNKPPSGGGGGGGGGGSSSSSGISTGTTNFQANPSGIGTVVAPGLEREPDYNPMADLNPGWNAGAHSIDSVPAGWRGLISFDVPDIDGARPGGVAVGVAGVSTLPTVGRNGYQHLRYGLIFTASTLRVIHDGAVVASAPYSAILAARAPGTTTDVVNVLMYGNFIKWIVNRETVFAGAFTMDEPYALDAVLYIAPDAVDNPEFVAGDWGDIEDGSLNGVMASLQMTGDATLQTSLEGSMQGLAAQLSDRVVWNLFGSFGALGFEAGQGEGISASIGPIEMIAAESSTYGAMVASIGGLSAWIGMDVPDETVEYSVLAPSFKRMTMTATVPATGAIEASMSQMVMRASAETTYSEIVAEIGGLRFSGYGGEMTPLVQIMEIVGVLAPLMPNFYIALAFIEHVGGTATAVVQATTFVDGTETVTAQDSATQAATMFSAIIEQLAVGDRMTAAVLDATTGMLMDAGEALVVNTAANATTRYGQYGFNSFAAMGGKHYGVRADGVYLLEGADDAGRAIKSGVALGQHDFGTQALKHIDAVYAGVSSKGTLFLKVGDGKSAYTYRARRHDPHMKVQRFDVGRGIRTNYFTFDLTSEADAFELDSVTFHVLPSQRRI